MKSHKSKIFFWFSAIMAIVVLFLWLSGRLLFWAKGIEYVADVPSGFINHKGYVLSGKSTVSLDLSNLESNIGKEVYNDDQHKIYVSWIRNTGDINKGVMRYSFVLAENIRFQKLL